MKQKTGLALGGGAALGAAHIGVLKAMEENNITVDYISGTSIGAFVASFYAFGKGWEEMKEIAEELNWLDIAGISLSKYGLLSNKKLGNLLTKHIGNKNIEDAKIPLAIVATDVSNGEKVVLKNGSVSEAVVASMSIPGIFKPIKINKKILVDGGVVENVPTQTVKELGAKYIIGVDLNSKHSYDKPGNIIDIILNSFHFIMKQSVKMHTQKADLLIEPDLSSFSRAKINPLEDILETGYKEAMKSVKNFK